MGAMKKKGILIDRKILAQLAEQNPETFKNVVNMAIAHSTPATKTPKEAVAK